MAEVKTQATLILNTIETEALVGLLGSMSASDVKNFINSVELEQAIQDIYVALDPGCHG